MYPYTVDTGKLVVGQLAQFGTVPGTVDTLIVVELLQQYLYQAAL